ncbi:SMI1/KNR4 family protein [Bartonella sp. 220]|uniref:SMI1/KNR4 family protein n=1 Tax=Bartonella sp. 220B TaxID=2967260 RepID=UPI0022A9E190|nr:SMI1/KNR4 family protein [Bartonella sp. 220B]MCZ2159252.1 SMI1/KNR4 family protein [Bartonella sp. 220B]
MKIYTLDDVRELVDKYNDIINFGAEDDEDNETDDLLIKKAEKALGLQFTSSYKVFLKKYGGGEIGGEEICSVYDTDFEIVRSDDIVYKNLNYRKKGFATPEQLVVSRTDFGETFYFDYTQFRDGECPLYLKFPPKDPQYYASNFYEFLCKRIKDHAGEYS